MSAFDHGEGEMFRFSLSDHSIDALLDGRVAADGAISEGRRPALTKVLTAKVAAAVVVAVAVLGGGVAAAATGSLPTSLQTRVSHGLSAVGISVPDPSAHPSNDAHPSTGTGGSAGATSSSHNAPTSAPPTQAVGPSASGPAAYGLCTAYAASNASQAASHSVAFGNLAAAAKAKNESVTQYCAGVTPSSTASQSSPGNPSGTHGPSTAGARAGSAP